MNPTMTTIEVLLVVLILLIALPWASYTAAKLGTVGYLRGKELFHRNSNDKETKNNGS